MPGWKHVEADLERTLETFVPLPAGNPQLDRIEVALDAMRRERVGPIGRVGDHVHIAGRDPIEVRKGDRVTVTLEMTDAGLVPVGMVDVDRSRGGL